MIDREFGKNIIDRRVGKYDWFNEKNPNRLNLNIETWADVDRKTYMCWGDYWVKQELLKAFKKVGVNVSVKPVDADVTLYLWGSPFPIRESYPFFYNPYTYNVAWFYSNPSKMTRKELTRYDLVFCLSELYLKLIKDWTNNIYPEPLLSCTNFGVPKNKVKKNIDILFVGNARGGMEKGRVAVSWLDPPKNSVVKIYGHKWIRHEYMRKWYADIYWPFEKLNELYNRSKITLVDGHDDMNRLGFVQMKIFDVLASGGFVISSHNTGIKKIFGDAVPMYKSADEMNELIKFYLVNHNEREKKIASGMAVAVKEKYMHRAKKIVSVLAKKLQFNKKPIRMYGKNINVL